MGYAIQWVRSLLFIGTMYVAMAIVALIYFPPALISRDGAYRGIHFYTGLLRWLARWMVGLKTEIRGTPPDGEVIVAAKHQSFLDIIMIVDATPQPRFVMKALLKWAPILGFYAWRIGCIPVDRGKRAKAVEQMVSGVNNNRAGPGQLVIYPQGTRVAPGDRKPYKIGPAVLYERLGQTCVPVATNVGVFWPRHGIYRKPGTAVVEFLDPIPPGLSNAEFMAKLEDVVETHSDRLMREAGFEPEAQSDDVK